MISLDYVVGLMQADRQRFFSTSQTVDKSLFHNQIFLQALRSVVPSGFYSEFFGENHLYDVKFGLDGKVYFICGLADAIMDMTDVNPTINVMDGRFSSLNWRFDSEMIYEMRDNKHKEDDTNISSYPVVQRVHKNKVSEQVRIDLAGIDDDIPFFQPEKLYHRTSDTFVLAASRLIGFFDGKDLHKQRVSHLPSITETLLETECGKLVVGMQQGIRVYESNIDAYYDVPVPQDEFFSCFQVEGNNLYFSIWSRQGVSKIDQYNLEDRKRTTLFQGKSCSLEDIRYPYIALNSGGERREGVLLKSLTTSRTLGRYSSPSLRNLEGLTYVRLDHEGSVSHRATVPYFSSLQIHPSLPIACAFSLETIPPKKMQGYIPDVNMKVWTGSSIVSLEQTGWRGNAVHFYVIGLDFPVPMSSRVSKDMKPPHFRRGQKNLARFFWFS